MSIGDCFEIFILDSELVKQVWGIVGFVDFVDFVVLGGVRGLFDEKLLGLARVGNSL